LAMEQKPTVGRRLQAMVFGLVPGLAHVLLLDRTGLGTLYFMLFFAGVDAAFTGRFLLKSESASDLYTAGCALAVPVWLWAYIDMTRLILLRNYEKRAAMRKTLSSEGVHLYAEGKMRAARKAFRACLALDHRDPDILFWYACVETRRGKFGRARRAFKRCRKYDLDGKWNFQVGEQEGRLPALEAAAKEAAKARKAAGIAEPGDTASGG
jgi:hypothetical protein